MRLFDMTDAQLDAAVERHYDRMLDRWLSDEDPWDHDDPDADAVFEIVNEKYSDKQIADLVRDFIEGDGDLWCDICDAGLLERYIYPEDAWMLKDPDDEWKLVEPIFEKHWNDNDFMVRIWEGFEKVSVGICDHLKRLADRGDADDIRHKYNEQRSA